MKKVQKNRYKNKQDAIKNPSQSLYLSLATKNKIKLKLDHKLTDSWWTGIEVQYLYYRLLDHYNHGYALSNTQKWKGEKLRFSFKETYFNAQDHHVSAYFYEPNPLYCGTQFKPYVGQGISISCLLGWTPLRLIRLELKYSYTYFLKKFVPTHYKKNKKLFNNNTHNGGIQCIGNFDGLWIALSDNHLSIEYT